MADNRERRIEALDRKIKRVAWWRRMVEAQAEVRIRELWDEVIRLDPSQASRDQEAGWCVSLYTQEELDERDNDFLRGDIEIAQAAIADLKRPVRRS